MTDVLLPLAYELTDSIADPVPPELSSCGQELYDACMPLARHDHEHGWILAHLCEALGLMRQSVSDIVRETDEGPGWSPLTDVDRAPGASSEIDLLPALAQMVGVRLLPEMSDTDRRAAIREREGYWRGRRAALLSFAGRFTVDGQGVQVRERYDPALGAGVDAPYHGRVIVKRSRLRDGVDEADLRRSILSRIPAGLIYDVLITDDLDYDDVTATFADYDDVATRATDYTDLLGA